MILKESYSAEWIRGIQQKHKSDLILMEKVIFALTLLEQLKVSGLDFIFKGGTSLILLVGEPRRLSIDIDIIVAPENRDVMDETLRKVIDFGVFTEYEINERSSQGDIPKAHYKFYYHSAISNKTEYILLDLLFEENLYLQTINVPIYSQLLQMDSGRTEVKVPSIDCILGDKLTAFAPNTTGIRYGVRKELEIIKQLFDIANLFDIAKDVNIVKGTFDKIAAQEIKYRGIKSDSESVLKDIFHTATVIAYRGRMEAEHYNELLAGISKMKPFIFGSSFNLDTATQCAAKAAYLSMLLINDKMDIKKFNRNEDVGTLSISSTEFNKFNKLKKTDIEAFYYWFKAVELYEGVTLGKKKLVIGPGAGLPL